MLQQINDDPRSIEIHMTWLSTTTGTFSRFTSCYRVTLLVNYLEKAIQTQVSLNPLHTTFLCLCIAAMGKIKATCGAYLGSLLLQKFRERHDDGSYTFDKWSILEKVAAIALMNAMSEKLEEWSGLHSNINKLSSVICSKMTTAVVAFLHILVAVADALKPTGVFIHNSEGDEGTKMVCFNDGCGVQYIWVRVKDSWYFMGGEVDFKFDGPSAFVQPSDLLAQGHSLWFNISRTHES